MRREGNRTRRTTKAVMAAMKIQSDDNDGGRQDGVVIRGVLPSYTQPASVRVLCWYASTTSPSVP